MRLQGQAKQPTALRRPEMVARRNDQACAKGGMSQAGTATDVRISQPQRDPIDKQVLCSAMCRCDKAPDVGADGKQLMLACVAEQ
jgi:hypothetical protein